VSALSGICAARCARPAVARWHICVHALGRRARHLRWGASVLTLILDLGLLPRRYRFSTCWLVPGCL